MKPIKSDLYELELSPRQLQLVKLYKKAYGKVIFWTKKGKVRLLNPEEVIIFDTD